MSELLKRLSVALIGIPFALFVIWEGGILFAGSVMLITSVTLWEFYKLTEHKELQPNKILGIAFAFLFQFTLFSKISETGSIYFSYFEIILFVVTTLIFQLFSKNKNPIQNMAVTISGLLYIGLLLSSLIGIREFASLNNFHDHYSLLMVNSHSNNTFAYIVICIFLSVWICDSAAYFIGKSFGKHKLFPTVSPKKSWEGAVAGFFGAILAFAGFMYLFVPHFPIMHSLIMGIIIGIFGQIGDLVESQLKRDAGVKDSGTILPGHGGFLDRFDSIIFVSPLIYFYLFLIFVKY